MICLESRYSLDSPSATGEDVLLSEAHTWEGAIEDARCHGYDYAVQNVMLVEYDDDTGEELELDTLSCAWRHVSNI